MIRDRAKATNKRTFHAPSYRKLTIGLVGLALLIIVIILLFSKSVSSNYMHRISRHAVTVRGITELHGELQYLTQIFANIEGQLTLYGTSDEEKLNNLKDAYLLKRNDFRIRQQELLRETMALKNDSTTMESEPWAGYFIAPGYTRNIDKLHDEIASLIGISEQALPPMDRFLLFSSTGIRDQLFRIQASLDLVTDQCVEQSARIHDKSLQWVNTGLLVLFLMLIGLAFLLHRIITVGFRFVNKSYDLLAQHDYDSSLLPSLRGIFQEEVELHKQAHSVIGEQSFLEQVKEVAGRGYVIEDVLENLFRHIQPYMPVNRLEIAFVNQLRNTVVTDYVVSDRTAILLGPGHETRFNSSFYSECMENGKPVIFQDIDDRWSSHQKGDPLYLLSLEGIRSTLMFPLFMNGAIYAFLFFGSIHLDCFGPDECKMGKNIAIELSTLLDKTLLTKTMFSKLSTTFALLVDKKDVETGDHILRMVGYSTLIAKQLTTHADGNYRINKRFVRDISNNAAIHDIGKVAIPDHILKKPGKLNEEEWAIMRTHSAIGADVVQELKVDLMIFRQDFFEVAENIARYHHERWDGSGYPEGLKGADIPIEARIVAVADVFDALTSKRTYKEAWSFEDAFTELQAIAGSHLDPVLVPLFLASQDEVRAIYQQNR